MKFEIINPHDPYALEAPDFATALAAIGLLGEGNYGIEGGGFKAPPVPFGPDWSPDVYAAAGVTGATDLFGASGRLNRDPTFNEATAAALESVRCDGCKTSMTDLERRGKEMAKALRGKRAFAGTESE